MIYESFVVIIPVVGRLLPYLVEVVLVSGLMKKMRIIEGVLGHELITPAPKKAERDSTRLHLSTGRLALSTCTDYV